MRKHQARQLRRNPRPGRKTGSVMIMVVALLVLMALIGTAYIATARYDRGSAVQNSNNVQIDLLVESVLTMCKTSVAADLLDGNGNYRTLNTTGTLIGPKDTWYYNHTTSTLIDPLTNERFDYWLSDRTPDYGPTGANGTDHYYWGRISQPLTSENEIVSGTLSSVRGYFEDPTYYPNPGPINATTNPLLLRFRNGFDTELEPTSKIWNGVPMPAFLITTSIPGVDRALAADADGDGVADSFLVRMPIGTVNGLTYYYAVRIIDNAAALNINTAWADLAVNSTGASISNGQRLFPSSVNLIDLIPGNASLANAEFDKLRMFRTQASPPYNPNSGVQVQLASPITDGHFNNPSTIRNDFLFYNEHDAFWTQLGRRIENPGYIPNGSLARHYRAFPMSDMVALSAHFILNARYDTTASENVLFNTLGGPRMAAGVRTKAYAPDDIMQNDFSWGHQNFWYDPPNGSAKDYARRPLIVTSNSVSNAISPRYSRTEDTNNDGILSAAEDINHNQRIDPLVATNDMLPYYPSEIVPFNQASNIMSGDYVWMYDDNNVPIPYIAEHQVGSISPWAPQGDWYWEFQPYFTQPLKASLNTATFRELYRAYWNVMSGDKGNDTPYGELVPPPAPPGAQPPDYSSHDPYAVPHIQHQFRSSLRDVHKTTAGFGTFTYRFPPFQQLLLRAALASVNTIDMRDNDDDVTSRRIFLRITDNTTQQGRPISNSTREVEVTVYGFERQPFITEVYAHTDVATPLPQSGVPNPKGYVAVELFNPFDKDINLDGWVLGLIDRRRTDTSNVTPPTPDRWKHTIIPLRTLDNTFIVPKNGGYLVLDNHKAQPLAAEKYAARARPPHITITGTPKFVYELYRVFEDPSNGNPSEKQGGGELVLLRPRKAGGTAPLYRKRDVLYDRYDEGDTANKVHDLVPVDQFDFTGLKLKSAPAAGGPPIKVESWHYMRTSGTSGDNRWKCVYPGRYDAGVPVTRPRHELHAKQPWDAPLLDPNDGVAKPQVDVKLGAADIASYTNNFPPIQLNNRDFPGPMPITGDTDPDNPYFGQTGNKRVNSFPFGGFQRVGDIMQVPFMGAYRVREVNVDAAGNHLEDNTTHVAQLKYGADVFLELNTLPMDCSFADDAIAANDAFENVGRFCPLMESFYTSFSPTLNPPFDPKLVTHADWRLHTYDFAHRVFDYFTVIAPNDDYFPNVNPDRTPDPNKDNTPFYRFRNNNTPPRWERRLSGNAGPNNLPREHAEPVKNIDDGTPNSDDRAGIHGLININTANWKVLSTVPFTNNLAINEQIAKAIVSYRDYGDVTVTPNRPPRPFESVLDLMNVRIKINNQVTTFAELHYPPGSNPPNDPNDQHGDFSPFDYDTSQPPALDQVTDANEFEQRYLLINRISNLLTTRSDSFTAYVIVQGWRNANTKDAELVVQRRAAMLIDRSTVTKDNREPRTMLIPVE
jgi:hypothetical protein